MEVTLIPSGVVKMADVSEAGKYDTEVDASVKLSASSKTVSAFPDGVSAELKLPYAVTTGNLKGTELTIKRESTCIYIYRTFSLITYFYNTI